MSYERLAREWEDVLARRPAFHAALRAYGEIVAAWRRWSPAGVTPLGWTASECQQRWKRGVPLLADTVPALPPDALEPLLAPVLDVLAMVGVDEAALQRFARAWDSGEVTPAALLPGARAAASLEPLAWAFLGYAGLRPVLEAYFGPCQAHLAEGLWQRGVCPFCGAAAAFTDLLENGARRLVCHFCGGGWTFPRLRCPACDMADAKQLVKFQGEDKEEGYLISACRACQSYVKELDRRLRWNGGSALVEDWGSPHLDVFAHRAGYRRAVPTLIELEQATRSHS